MTTGNQINVQEIRLLTHNKVAYNAVKNAFKTRDRAAVVHATGSGKSYIIARTAQDFSKVLVIAPNDFVLNETRKICPPRCHFITYTGVICAKEPMTGYNLIVLDEFHRAGAEQWGKSVKQLLDDNPHAKVLGTSATDIRYLDGMRNMGDELFDGNVVSRISLKDAIDLGILPNPTYVSSLYTLEGVTEKATAHINNSQASEDDKASGLKHLKGVKDSWQKASGVPAIIKKYFHKDMKRVIVFCTDVKMANHCRAMLQKWFKHAGYNFLNFYDINYANKNLQHEMYLFQQDIPGLQIAISVNMLNEGVHIPNVDAVIMLRSTLSRIIIEQQIGRCLTAKNTRQSPVVLDLVNNMDGLNNLGYYYGAIASNNEATRPYEHQPKEEPFPFRVIDETSDIRQLMTDIYGKFHVFHSVWTKEACAEEAQKYQTRKEFAVGNASAYQTARVRGWLKEICSHMTAILHFWTKEEVLAKASEYTYLKDFRTEQSNMYIYAINKGWKDDINALLIVQKGTQWTVETCAEEAKKFQTRTAFSKGSHNAYSWANSHGHLDTVCSHMKPVTNKRRKWTKKSVLAKALKYTGISDMKAHAPSAVNYAKKHGFYNELVFKSK